MSLEDGELTPKQREPQSMQYLVGVGLALVVCAFAMATGFDRGRVFYPTPPE